MTTHKQERPAWCPHTDCLFQRRAQDALCGGKLPGGDLRETDEFGQVHVNDLRICMNETIQPPPNAKVIDFKVNSSDLDWIRWIFDALDGKETSWLSKGEKNE